MAEELLYRVDDVEVEDDGFEDKRSASLRRLLVNPTTRGVHFLMLVGESNCLRSLYPQDRVCSWITFRCAFPNYHDTVINGRVTAPFTPTSHPCKSNLQPPFPMQA
jgi:hypothetical protein